jgi:hypothetical protein
MKNVFFMTAGWLILLSTPMNAQDTADTVKLWTKYPGYIIKMDGDTVHGVLLLKNKIANQGKVFFFDSMEAEEPSEKFKAKEIKAYKVADRFYESKKYTPEYTAMKYSFLLKVIDGPLSLYKAFYDDKERIKINEDDIWQSKIDLSFSESELKEQRMGCREGEDLVFFDGAKFILGFKKQMSKYLSDCPEIANKIANKEEGYQWGDLEKIIREYNAWYISNH